MKNGLYYCDARQLSLGASDTYRLNWIKKNSTESCFIEIANSAQSFDEFCDEWTVISCSTSSTVTPIKKIRYQHNSGDTGFEEFASNDAGCQPDSELKNLFEFMLEDSWIWSFQKKEFISFAKNKQLIGYPGEFFHERRSGAPLISIHSPNSILLNKLNLASAGSELLGERVRVEPEVMAVYELHGVQKFSALLSVAKNCKYLIAWQLSDGLNPVVIAEEMDEFLISLKAFCDSSNIPLREVDTEDDLPVW